MTHSVTRLPFKTGVIVRIGTEPAALLRIDSIAYNHTGLGQHRYYGEQCDGSSRAANHLQCQAATELDLAFWADVRGGHLARTA